MLYIKMSDVLQKIKVRCGGFSVKSAFSFSFYEADYVLPFVLCL
jgi:hypothetical protein